MQGATYWEYVKVTEMEVEERTYVDSSSNPNANAGVRYGAYWSSKMSMRGAGKRV